MNILTPKTETATEQNVTMPRKIVEVHFPQVLRIAQDGDVQWNGQTWQYIPLFDVGAIKIDRNGGKTSSLKLPNHDGAYGVLCLTHGIKGRRVRIWELAGEPDYAPDDPKLEFDGIMNGSKIGLFVTIGLTTTTRWNQSVPDVPLSAVMGDDLIVPGTEVKLNGGTLILETRNG